MTPTLIMKYFEKFMKFTIFLCNFLKISPGKKPHPVYWLLLLISLCVNVYFAVFRYISLNYVRFFSVIILDELPTINTFVTLFIYSLDSSFFRRKKIFQKYTLLNILQRRVNNHFGMRIKCSKNIGTLWSSLLVFLTIISAILYAFNFLSAKQILLISTLVFLLNATFMAVVTLNIYLNITKIYTLLKDFNDTVSYETKRSSLWIIFSPNQYKYTEIKFYVRTYWGILKVIAEFNDIYGIHILNILIQVILINLNLFNIAMKILFGIFKVRSIGLHFLTSLSMVTTFLYMGGLIISACENVNREKSRINDILLGMLQFKIIRSSDDKGPEMRALILKAINAIDVENIELTAAGLFPLNYRTLFVIVRLIPAYFLIVPKDM